MSDKVRIHCILHGWSEVYLPLGEKGPHCPVCAAPRDKYVEVPAFTKVTIPAIKKRYPLLSGEDDG